MFNKKILAASMAAAITTGGMVAQTSAMQVAANNVGQVLLGGAYYVENGYSTDIVVVNTRTDAAVLAKIVFRSHKKSREVLDFFIYLSPGDTWRGTLSMNGTNAHIFSDDDSVLNANGTAWGDVSPLDVDFFTDKLTAGDGDSNTFGHFEVISYLTAGGDGAGTAYATPAVAPLIVVEPGMTKEDVRTLMSGGTRSLSPATHCTAGQLVAADVISAAAPCATELMAEVVIRNDNNRGSYKPTALAFDGIQAAADTPVGTAQYVIANPLLIMSIGSESLIGNGWEIAGLEWINEVEMALANQTSSYPWESNGTNQGTHVVATFPTKYRHEDDLLGFCGAGSAGGGVATAVVAPAPANYSAPFADTTTGEIAIAFAHFDNSENTTGTPTTTISGGLLATADVVPDEVNYLTPTYMGSSDSGWAVYNWNGSHDPLLPCSYAGVPVVAYTYKFEVNSDFRHMMETLSHKR